MVAVGHEIPYVVGEGGGPNFRIKCNSTMTKTRHPLCLHGKHDKFVDIWLKYVKHLKAAGMLIIRAYFSGTRIYCIRHIVNFTAENSSSRHYATLMASGRIIA